MTVGQLAEASGVSADTIRYYERIGLIPPARRSPAGYRLYPPGARSRIRVIRNAVQLGFPLQEIAKVLDRNVCRCGTYPRIVQAIKLAAERMRTSSNAGGRR